MSLDCASPSKVPQVKGAIQTLESTVACLSKCIDELESRLSDVLAADDQPRSAIYHAESVPDQRDTLVPIAGHIIDIDMRLESAITRVHHILRRLEV
jgi:outer membrane murein-binding lipoprotein Lpp